MKRQNLEWVLGGERRRPTIAGAGREAAESRPTCPVRGCGEHREPWHVMCFRHWRMVPKQLAFRIYDLNRDGKGGAEHLAAIREAIDAVNMASVQVDVRRDKEHRTGQRTLF